MHPYTFIALMGRAGAGKDTAAEYLRRTYDFQPYAFAAPIKAMLETLLVEMDLDYAHLHEPALKQEPIAELYGISGRELMTSLGNWGRSQHPQLWIRAAQRALGLPLSPVAPRIVLTDVRYPNEAAWVRAMGGRIWRIQRDALPTVPQHSSEWSQHDIVPDVTITNDLTREALYFALDQEWRRHQYATHRLVPPAGDNTPTVGQGSAA